MRMFWPTRCGVCRLWGWQHWCQACLHAHAADATIWPRCTSCGLRVPSGLTHCADCHRQPPLHRRAVVAVDYAFPWDGLIARMKFQQQPQMAAGLSELMLRALLHTPGAVPHDPSGDEPIVVPMPLSRERLQARGYNQAWELARRVARRLQLQSLPEGLQRHVDLPRQSDLERAQRLTRLQGVFTANPRYAGDWSGRTVALVDDVYTTGATVAEATRVLLASGAAQVDVWVLARTPPPQDESD